MLTIKDRNAFRIAPHEFPLTNLARQRQHDLDARQPTHRRLGVGHNQFLGRFRSRLGTIIGCQNTRIDVKVNSALPRVPSEDARSMSRRAPGSTPEIPASRAGARVWPRARAPAEPRACPGAE